MKRYNFVKAFDRKQWRKSAILLETVFWKPKFDNVARRDKALFDQVKL